MYLPIWCTKHFLCLSLPIGWCAYFFFKISERCITFVCYSIPINVSHMYFSIHFSYINGRRFHSSKETNLAVTRVIQKTKKSIRTWRCPFLEKYKTESDSPSENRVKIPKKSLPRDPRSVPQKWKIPPPRPGLPPDHARKEAETESASFGHTISTMMFQLWTSS